MLQIKGIKKTYVTGELVQTALDGVSLNLRDNEFVAILGPSGSGKTTLLNVIGGLDRYDSGDLVINGISTKKYTDRDWDSYRNHTIGFVFQSYNLIPHQSVLANVELALTISGISRSERRRRAARALESVGLGNQLHKRPNQMSGGQMQRVAIARALVNDPDILLADEPTGALDSETSVQVMELLKEVSRDHLVVMVTHNPELAEDYANRIVRVKDGRIIGDNNPFAVDDRYLDAPRHKNMGKSTMSFFTALSLSFNNLLTKKARTLLTAFAGSIGIIGIALIMSLSTGFQKYIDKIQADTLSNYPLTIQTETSDMSSMFSAFGTTLQAASEAEPETVVEQQMISQMFAQVGSNDLGSFKKHLESNYEDVTHTITTIQYSYGVSPRIYCEDMTYGIVQSNPSTLLSKVMGNSLMASFMNTNVFYEMVDNLELLNSQYDVLRGRWPESYDEMVIVLPGASQITDHMSYTLGLKDPKELESLMTKVMAGEAVESVSSFSRWTYEDLMELRFRLVPVASLYRYNEEYAVWEDMSEDEAFLKARILEGEPLKIVGIVCAREGVNATALSAGVAYTSDLTAHVMQAASETEIVQNQLKNQGTNVFTGAPFHEKASTELNFEEMISVDADVIKSAFGMNISEEGFKDLLINFLKSRFSSLKVDTAPAAEAFKSTFSVLGKDMLRRYVESAGGGEVKITLSDAKTMADTYLATEEAGATILGLTAKYGLSETLLRNAYRSLLTSMVIDYVVSEHALPELEIPETTQPAETQPEATEGTAPETEAPTEPETTEAPTEPEAPTETEAPTVPDVTEPISTETTLPAEPEVTEPAAPETEAPSEPEATEPVVPEATEVAVPDGTEPSPAETKPPEASAEENSSDTLPEPTSGETTPPPSSATPAAQTEHPAEEDSDTEPKPSDNIYAMISEEKIDELVDVYAQNTIVQATGAAVSLQLVMNAMSGVLSNLTGDLEATIKNYIGGAFSIDTDAFAKAFRFNMSEEDLQRLMLAMSGQSTEQSAKANLQTLGYADPQQPTSMSIYLRDFEAKEEFLTFLDGYNEQMELYQMEDYVIRYTDMTGIMMSSVRTIIDSVSYALIAFVAVSLVVSSIMIGIITYISVMERTKEIGVLRAIGASKKNISQVFNAETFIIGLCSGLIGIGITLLLLIPGNMLIQHLTENPDIVAQLPAENAVVLILLSMVLTLIGGFIPAKQAAKKDPVIALRSE